MEAVIEVIMERMRGRGGAFGGVLSLCSGLQIEQLNKKERGNNELALSGHRFMFRHNNPLIVQISNGRDDGEDTWPRQSVWGVLFLCLGRQIKQQKKIQM
jgi:hypothetical protein